MARPLLSSCLARRRARGSLVARRRMPAAQTRRPAGRRPAAGAQCRARPASSPRSSCIGCSWATSRCSAAILRSPRAPTTKRRAKRATRGSPGARPRLRLPRASATLALDAATLWSGARSRRPTAPKQVIAGPQGRRRRPRRPISRPSSSARWPKRRPSGPRLGEAFLQLNRVLAREPDKAATFKLVRSLAQPYPNNARGAFRRRARRVTTRASPDFESTTASRCRRSIGRSRRSRTGSRRSLLKVEILGKQSLDRAADYLVEFLKTDARLEGRQSRRWCRFASSRSGTPTPPRFCRSSRKRTRATTSTSSAWRCSRCRRRIGRRPRRCSRN